MSYKPLPFNQYFIDVSQGLGGETSVDFGYKKITYLHHKHEHYAYYKVLYNAARDCIQIFFKETTDDTGWAANFDFAEDYYDSFDFGGKNIQLKVHNGWNIMYRAMKHYIRDDFREAVKEYISAHGLTASLPTVEIIGWSLGSGQAQLCAQDLFFNFGYKPIVITFGSVKPWYKTNDDMLEYLTYCYKECYNFCDVNDIVTYMPPFPKYFMLHKKTVAQDKFNIFRLFKPGKYHTEYYKDLYGKE